MTILSDRTSVLLVPLAPSQPSPQPPAGRRRVRDPAEESTVSGLDHLNAAPPGAAEDLLLACCGSRRWARRLVEHRPYPDRAALLAAADEAGYDLTPADVAEALAREAAPGLPGLPQPDAVPPARGAVPRPAAVAVPMEPGPRTPPVPAARRPGVLAAQTALRAAHAAYEARFGHVFVICLDGVEREEALDHVLAGIRARLGHDPEEERLVTAEELRRLARGRLARLTASASRP